MSELGVLRLLRGVLWLAAGMLLGAALARLLLEGSTSPAPARRTVFVSVSGSKYHATRQCGALAHSEDVTETTIAEAEERGYEPCGLCH